MLDAINISAIALALVLLLIAIRQLGEFKLQIWQIMLLGALLVLLSGEISPVDAASAINPDVMIFLAGMFVIGEAMRESGYLFHLFNRIFCRAKNLDQLLLLILFAMGFLSALLMNDTLAIIGTPLMLYLAQALRISPKLLLLTLAFAVTTGSAMSPIGNPQNLLIAINGSLTNPFLVFFQYLFIPTVANLVLAYLLLRLFYKSQFQQTAIEIPKECISDPTLANISRISIILLLILILAKVLAVTVQSSQHFSLTYIAIFSALPVILFSSRRWEIMKHIDWCTLVFFAAMFVLMDSVWRSGFFQSMMEESSLGFGSIPVILALSVFLSQIISNVPFVALFQPLLINPSAQDLMALAAGSTIAGNLFILGAASNVIIIQNAEKSGETLTFLDFARVGVPLTALNVFVYWIFL
ncbi:MAG TPA: SLC13 family permease [Methanothrix soehngenii]|jgi:Na+/H+ antiporter NhaD/arsenite permease-like protein|uniref:Anion transporter n=2 Tax=Methanothrix soehngenii TaxID=2223 RepID=A0A7K4AJR2_METSH|nr:MULTISPECIES: SLC13 family permease [Methanothrix]NLJ23204.1 anion transporter [Methanothrix soehngenii]HOE46747.1 SLC13 family permease [Methanothrix soehngenii]HOI19536.1 SLC13 family permease [Methanothrix soehngenii]HOS22986.1 SLC13 family permease [Methanothrix soehngenii]